MKTSQTQLVIKTPRPTLKFRVWEEAYSAVSRLRALKPLLSEQDEEALAILIDKKLLGHLEKSMREAEEGKLEPLKNILV